MSNAPVVLSNNVYHGVTITNNNCHIFASTDIYIYIYNCFSSGEEEELEEEQAEEPAAADEESKAEDVEAEDVEEAEEAPVEEEKPKSRPPPPPQEEKPPAEMTEAEAAMLVRFNNECFCCHEYFEKFRNTLARSNFRTFNFYINKNQLLGILFIICNLLTVLRILPLFNENIYTI
uniref:Uncharacterized protein n=1 Tax=Heterorhabditis bacteriophora TaxID=37862 RepID=A0A1I7XQT1_HETBA